MFTKIQKRMKGEKGFTLIELLVVIIIIAILAAIAIPTFLGQRSKAQDASAKSLIRNAMTSIESAYVDARTYAVTAADLMAIEPSITFQAMAAATGICTDAAITTTGAADSHSVQYFGTATSYEITTASLSGNLFGVHAEKTAGGGTTFVKKLGANVTTGW
jgi:type IV pilus assembly protein PilA